MFPMRQLAKSGDGIFIAYTEGSVTGFSGDKGRAHPNFYGAQNIPTTKKDLAETLVQNAAYGLHLVKA